MSETPNLPDSPDEAGSQPPSSMVTSEQFIDELRALMARVPDLPTLTPQARRALQRVGRVSASEAQAAINVVQASDKVAGTVEAMDEIQRMLEAANRWTAAESELKAAWQKVTDANLVRWRRIADFTSQTFGIGTLLARHPENADLPPHVQQARRRRRSHHRRKPRTKAADRASPEPAPPTTEEPRRVRARLETSG